MFKLVLVNLLLLVVICYLTKSLNNVAVIIISVI